MYYSNFLRCKRTTLTHCIVVIFPIFITKDMLNIPRTFHSCKCHFPIFRLMQNLKMMPNYTAYPYLEYSQNKYSPGVVRKSNNTVGVCCKGSIGSLYHFE